MPSTDNWAIKIFQKIDWHKFFICVIWQIAFIFSIHVKRSLELGEDSMQQDKSGKRRKKKIVQKYNSDEMQQILQKIHKP